MKKRKTPQDAAWIEAFRERYPEEVRGMDIRAGKSGEDAELVREWENRKFEGLLKRAEGLTMKAEYEAARESWTHPDIDANSGVEDCGEPDSRNLRDYRDFEQQRNWEDEMAGRIRKSVPKVKEADSTEEDIVRAANLAAEEEDQEDAESRVYGEKLPEGILKNGGCATGDHEPADSPIPYKTVKMCAKCRVIYVPKV